jgi:hypothetical protein
MDNQIKEVLGEIDLLGKVYTKLITLLPSFNVTDKSVLPYGLKPHTRSISWLVEQVITQQTKYRRKELGLTDVDIDMPDTCLHDCVIHIGKKEYYVNVKIHNVGGKENKNDIAAVEKLYMQYVANPSYNLVYACFGISFEGIRINFDKSYLQLFSPQFLPIYVNPRNDKIQAFYEHKPVIRTRAEFLKELQSNSKSIVLK